MVRRYWLQSSYYRNQSQLMGVFMEINDIPRKVW